MAGVESGKNGLQIFDNHLGAFFSSLGVQVINCVEEIFDGIDLAVRGRKDGEI